jgi:hypothetical protein
VIDTERMEDKELAKLAKPGNFFDFTRYRPILYYEEGIRQVKIPNTTFRGGLSGKGASHGNFEFAL